MAVPVLMPRQGQSVETCIMGTWLKKKGDHVNVGDILFSYETDKASFEEEAKEEGILLEIFFNEGDEVAVLENVAVIGAKGESIEEFSQSGSKPAAAEASTETAVVAEVITETPVVAEAPKEEAEITISEDGSESVKISPRARKNANDKGIDFQKLKGSGPKGRIIDRDIEASAYSMPVMTSLAKEKAANEKMSAGEEASGIGGRILASDLVSVNQVYGTDFEVKKLSHMRKLIAKAMFESLQSSAQLTHHMSADARTIMALRKRLKKDFEAGNVPQNITINDLVCLAVIKALKKFPQANTHFTGDSMRWYNKVHLGLAVDTERGLMVPAVKNADDLSIEGLSAQLSELAAQCRQGNINPELLSPEAATFTVSNLGNYGVEMFTPVINLPQAAILGVCTIVPRPKDLGDGVYGFCPMMGLSLTYNHQALDGGEATLFLREIKDQIENLVI